MRKVSLKFGFLLFAFCCLGGGAFARKNNALYTLPENTTQQETVEYKGTFLVGTDDGLYQVFANGSCKALWTGGKVSRILQTSLAESSASSTSSASSSSESTMATQSNLSAAAAASAALDVSVSDSNVMWYFVTDDGIVRSRDLVEFTPCNNGLPVLTIKEYDGTNKSFVTRVHPLKDICADPLDPNVLVTATKDAIYLSRNGGDSWTNIGSTSKNTAGMKAVAVAHMPVYSGNQITGSELVVFQSHPIYGFSYYRADASRPAWTDVSSGFAIMQSLTQVDEISDIIPVVCQNESGQIYVDIYCAQTFIPNLYRFNWQTKRAEKLYTGTEKSDTIDSLCQSNDLVVFNTLGKVSSYSITEKIVKDLPAEEYANWKSLLNVTGSIVNAAFIPADYTGLGTPLLLSELWMMKPEEILTPYGDTADGRKAIYVSPYYVRNAEGIAKYKNIITSNKLNAIVVDMKDDYGLLRFDPESALLKQKGKVSQYKVDLNQFVTEFKKDDIYLIARIVVFKDRNLASYGGNKYAVWNSSTKAPWVGTKGMEDVTDGDGNVTGQKMAYYDENWVDPYSEEVWEYNIEIAKELIARGFDEIQFDYIRFPTDGLNLSSASYRWRDTGMDKESALVSFLSYARKNINAPIGIDIYGANGWYRSGTRTGQDVELMSDYVDVICPMFYPSHFEQDFMEYSPVVERPYRIYFYGSYRNTVIGRNRIVVRPWAQAFYLNVRYDRTYYDNNYVIRQIYGVRDGLDRGYMYWNNSGRYDDISPDPADDALSPWYNNEGALQERLPAFSSSDPDAVSVTFPSASELAAAQAEAQRNRSTEMLDVWNSVLAQGTDEEKSAPVVSSSAWLTVPSVIVK